jgi:hypothetical protein
VADPNIFLGYELGLRLSGEVAAGDLNDPIVVARFVDEVDKPLFVDGIGAWDWVRAGQYLQQMADAGRRIFPGIPDPAPLGFALRLWAGCIWAAKIIDRPAIPAAERHRYFSQDIDPRARADRVFGAGVEAAAALNALRGRSEPTLDGVPVHSPVRRHLGVRG